ncbi:MAG: hypothetical protein Q9218_005257 [Villophora microphyllina]
MFPCLNSPSVALRDRLPGNTNYLNAYNPQGNLIRDRGYSAAPCRRSDTDSSENQVKEEIKDASESALGRNEFEEVNLPAASPLGYHIPSAKLRECMLASRSSRSAFWQYTFYQGPKGEKVRVHYCKSLETMERIAKLFLNESVIGFDIEWKPSASTKDGIRKNVALIQIASEERIALFHIARFAKGDTIDDLVAPTFKKIMESDAISKVGVSVKGDCTRLRNHMNIDSRGLFELSHLYKLTKFCTSEVKKINKSLVALAKQVEEHLLLPMYKDENVRGSDWSKDLNYDQIYYAASDSYAGFQLYHIMNNKRLAIDPIPPLPADAELNLPIRLANGQTVAEYEESVVEEPPAEEDTETKPLPPSIEQLVEDVKNIQIEDISIGSKMLAGQDREPPLFWLQHIHPASLSTHPANIAANEWVIQHYIQGNVAQLRKSETDSPTDTMSSTVAGPTSSSDHLYPVLPSLSSIDSSPSPPSSAATAAALPSPPSKNARGRLRRQAQPHASRVSLLAYHLCHYQGLDIETVAALLGAPKFIAAGYILDLVKGEQLPLDQEKADLCRLLIMNKDWERQWRGWSAEYRRSLNSVTD